MCGILRPGARLRVQPTALATTNPSRANRFTTSHVKRERTVPAVPAPCASALSMDVLADMRAAAASSSSHIRGHAQAVTVPELRSGMQGLRRAGKHRDTENRHMSPTANACVPMFMAECHCTLTRTRLDAAS